MAEPILYACDPDGSLRDADEALGDLLDVPVAQLRAGSPAWGALVHPDDADRVARARTELEPGPARSLEYRFLTRAGRVVRVADRVLARDEPGGRVLRGVLVDRGLSQVREAELRQDGRMEASGELASSLAHELNNPLSGVLNYAQLAQRVAPPDPRLEEALAGILAEGRRIQEIARALLVCAPADRGRFPLRPADVAHAALASVRRRLREELVVVSVDVPPDLPQVEARGLEVREALRHLLDNARDALLARFPGRDPQKRLLVRGRHDAPEGELGDVVIEVVDQGGGLDPAVADHLLEPFITTRPGRDGLGLFLARRLVERQGGTLEVVPSPDGPGVTARLRFPL